MDLATLLKADRIALDTAVFIYFMEENAEFLPTVLPIFEAIAAGQVAAVTSALTLLEVMVLPLRNGDTATAQQYEKLLLHSRGLTLADIDHAVLRRAAELRATAKVRTPDAIQLATAICTSSRYFVTNDRALADAGGVTVVQLRDLR